MQQHCHNCGAPLSSGDTFCQNCGAPVLPQRTAARGTRNGKLAAIIAIACALFILGGAAFFIIPRVLSRGEPDTTGEMSEHGVDKRTAADYIELGNRYLQDGEYEEAVLAFISAIKIDSKLVEAYVGLSEGYIALENYDKALKVLEDGYAATKAEELDKKLETVKAIIERQTPEPPAETAPAVSAEQSPQETTAFETPDAPVKTQDTTTPEAPAETPALSPPSVDYITIRGQEYSTSLTELHLNNEYLSDSDIEPLKYMTKLTYLNLDNNEISDLNPLKGLTALTRLKLDYNQVRDLSPLQGCTVLESLDLDDNQVRDLSPLKDLTLLFKLGLDNNQISDVSPLKKLNSLYRLDLLNNQISDISSLNGLASLEALDLTGNPITDWSPVAHIADVGGRP